MKYYDQLADPTIANLLTWGIEGTHYKMENGKATPILEMQKDWDDKIDGPYNSPMVAIIPKTKAISGIRNLLEQLADKLNAENEKYAVADPSLGLISETASQKGTDLNLMINDADLKFVAGVITEEARAKEIERWRTSGGDAIAKELQATYEKKKAGAK